MPPESKLLTQSEAGNSLRKINLRRLWSHLTLKWPEIHSGIYKRSAEVLNSKRFRHFNTWINRCSLATFPNKLETYQNYACSVIIHVKSERMELYLSDSVICDKCNTTRILWTELRVTNTVLLRNRSKYVIPVYPLSSTVFVRK